MSQNAAPTTTFAIFDPRSLDGNPYEVAERAVAQAAGLCRLQIQAVTDARVMARNAAMERQIAATDAADAPAWERGPEAARYDALLEQLGLQAKTLKILGQAAGFDPKAPIGRA